MSEEDFKILNIKYNLVSIVLSVEWLQENLGDYLTTPKSKDFTRAQRLQIARLLQSLVDKLELEIPGHTSETQIPC